MGIDMIKHLLECTENCEAWSLQLLQITPNEAEQPLYAARKLELKPDGSLTELVQEIRERYLKGRHPALDNFEAVEDYDGAGVSSIIYRLPADSPLIKTPLQSLMQNTLLPETEAGLQDFEPGASIIEGDIDNKRLLLVSMKSPFTTLRHKFFANEGTFRKITGKILTLRSTLDVIIYDSNVYMLSSEGEKLFLMERAYKAAVPKKAAQIVNAGIVTNGEALASFAARGFNPKRLISLNPDRLQSLQAPSVREKMHSVFSIPLVDGKFDTSTQESADKLIKLLCNKGMTDPFDGTAMEVAGAKLWK